MAQKSWDAENDKDDLNRKLVLWVGTAVYIWTILSRWLFTGCPTQLLSHLPLILQTDHWPTWQHRKFATVGHFVGASRRSIANYAIMEEYVSILIHQKLTVELRIKGNPVFYLTFPIEKYSSIDKYSLLDQFSGKHLIWRRLNHFHSLLFTYFVLPLNQFAG